MCIETVALIFNKLTKILNFFHQYNMLDDQILHGNEIIFKAHRFSIWLFDNNQIVYNSPNSISYEFMF